MDTTMIIRQEALPIVKSSLEMKRNALELNARQYQERLAALEQKHKMASLDFAKKFDAGELGDAPDWFEWQYVLDALQETDRQLALLKSVQL